MFLWKYHILKPESGGMALCGAVFRFFPVDSRRADCKHCAKIQDRIIARMLVDSKDWRRVIFTGDLKG